MKHILLLLALAVTVVGGMATEGVAEEKEQKLRFWGDLRGRLEAFRFSEDETGTDKDDRRRIWKQIWPDDTPRRADLDLDMDAMARNLEITGGNIRNIALAAAFLAADDGGIVNTSHLIRATQREYQKMGKVVMEGEFEKLLRPRRDLMRTIDSGEVQHESKRSS